MAATTRFADHLLTGTLAARPSYSAVPVGTLYSATDTGIVYQSTASAWGTWLAKPSAATDTIIDAKGDLIVGTAADTASRLAVGSNNQVLTADSAQTTGVKWATPSATGVAADTIWDTKGDLAVATGADTASKLAVGTNGQVLTADSAQSTGVKWATAAGGGAWTQLYNLVLGSPAANFDQSGISGSYNDLLLVFIGRSSRAVTQDFITLQFNGDTAANYGSQYMTANGTTAPTSGQGNSLTAMYIGTLWCNSAAASVFSMCEILIPGYASTTWKKNAIASREAGAMQAITAGNMYIQPFNGMWNSTAAITRVTLAPLSVGNFVTGSVLNIYGRT